MNLNKPIFDKSLFDKPLFSFNHEESINRRRKTIRSYRARADAKRSGLEKLADFMTAKFGSVTFLLLNALWFATWIVLNTNLIPGIEPFDPFPFGLLTMIVSLEAIFLAIIVLISQNRAAKVAEIREEVDLYINSATEGEVTKVIKMLVLLLKKNGIDVENDPELNKMLHSASSEQVEAIIEKELG